MNTNVVRLVKIVILQILSRYGYENCEDQAIQILAEYVIRYLKNLAISAKRYAELCDRSEVSLFDMFRAVDNFHIPLRLLKEHMENPKKGFELTFISSLCPEVFPNANSQKQRASPYSFLTIQNNYFSKGFHLPIKKDDNREPNPDFPFPDYLPPFPEKHTYQETKISKRNPYTEAEIKKIKSKNQRNLEDALCSLEKEIDPVKSNAMVDEGENAMMIEEKVSKRNDLKNPFNTTSKKIKSLQFKDLDEHQFS